VIKREEENQFRWELNESIYRLAESKRRRTVTVYSINKKITEDPFNVIKREEENQFRWELKREEENQFRL